MVFYYTSEGKFFKAFGPDDSDALSILSNFMKVHFISGDKRGSSISKKRVHDDMGYPFDLVSTYNRVEWIDQNYNLQKVVYMGDGIFDHFVMKKVFYSIAPFNADEYTKTMANFVTSRCGGDRAVAEACIHLMERFFPEYDRLKLPSEYQTSSSIWAA